MLIIYLLRCAIMVPLMRRASRISDRTISRRSVVLRVCTHGNKAALRALTTTSPPLPRILSSRLSDRLPLEVPNGVRAAAGERPYVIFPVARTSTGRPPGRWARVLPLEFSCHLSGSMLSRRKGGGASEREPQRDNEACARHPGPHSTLFNR